MLFGLTHKDQQLIGRPDDTDRDRAAEWETACRQERHPIEIGRKTQWERKPFVLIYRQGWSTMYHGAWTLHLQFWHAAAALAPAPLWLAIARLRTWRAARRRARAGLCRRCGYDLRASVDRCPECGSPFIPSTFHPATS